MKPSVPVPTSPLTWLGGVYLLFFQAWVCRLQRRLVLSVVLTQPGECDQFPPARPVADIYDARLSGWREGTRLCGVGTDDQRPDVYSVNLSCLAAGNTCIWRMFVWPLLLTFCVTICERTNLRGPRQRGCNT